MSMEEAEIPAVQVDRRVRKILPAVGMRILLLRPHPWHGFTGRVTAHEKFLGLPSARVALDQRSDVRGATGKHSAGMIEGTPWMLVED